MRKITVPEMAEFLECSEEKVYELLRTGVIGSVKFGKSYVVLEPVFFESIHRASTQFTTTEIKYTP